MSSENKKGVVFRRIRGRIVPVRQSKTRVDGAGLVQGSGLASLGIAISAAGGKFHRKQVVKASSSALTAFDSIKFNKKPDLFSFAKDEKARRVLKDSVRASNIAGAVRFGSKSLGAALIGLGTFKIAKASGQDRKVSPELAAAGSAGAAVAIEQGYKFSSKAFEFGAYNRSAVNKAAKQAGLKLLSVLKGIR